MDTSNRPMSRYPLQYFPNLGPDNHRITSNMSREYNCVAWAAGIDNQQLWPNGGEEITAEPEVTWPEGVRNDESVAALVDYFASLGYELCESPDYENGFLKVAIFAKDGCPTHASRQLPSRKWTSNMGFRGVDIEHADLECIAGNQYGAALAFLKRPAGGHDTGVVGAGD